MSSTGSVAYLAPAFIWVAPDEPWRRRVTTPISIALAAQPCFAPCSRWPPGQWRKCLPALACYHENCQQRRGHYERDGKESRPPDFVRGIQVGNALRHEGHEPLPQCKCVAGRLRLGFHRGARLAQRVRVKFARVSPATVTNFEVVVPLCHTLTLYLPSGTPAMK